MKRTKRILGLLLSLCLVLGLFPSTAFAASGNLPFTDMNTSDWYYDAVQYVYEKGMMNGTSITTFFPDDTTTRGMIVTILHRMEGTPAAVGTAFTDVPAGQWYSDAVSWASVNGIVDGYGGGMFGPNDPITREQMATILNRYSQHRGYETGAAGNIAGFSDASQVSSYAVDSMGWAIGNGLISGIGNNTLAPKGNATRAQVATILMRFCENVADKTYTVTFDLNYESDTRYNVMTVKEGETVSKPSNPSRSGYSFNGWYTEKFGGKQFDFKTGITSDLTLYAYWSSNSGSSSGGGGSYVPPMTEPTSYTVSFDSVGGSPVDSQTINKSDRVARPENPEKDGYVFAGWYMSREYSQEFDFYNTNISGDTVLYARWVDATDTTDSDGDGLTDPVEAYFTTNPLAQDTDGDGLSDYFEIVYSHTDPLVADTDGNGIMDGDEDSDGDGLTNLEEQNTGSEPLMADSDLDGLSDLDEVQQYDTNPLKSDSDDDGADDGWELEHGYDPTVYNSSFSVVIQPSQPSRENPVTAGVELTSSGGGASSVNVSKVDNNPLISESISGYLGDAFEFTTTGPVDRAVLTFTYDTSLGTIGESFQPRIYYFNEDDGTLEELPNQQVSDGCITVEVSHFSAYVLLNKAEFDEVWDAEIKPPMLDDEGNSAVLDIAFVIDYSASMDDNDSRQLFKGLSKNFVSKLRDGVDQAAVIKFIRKATVVSPLSTDKDALNVAIDSITYDRGYGSYSGTDGSTGIKTALDVLSDSESEYQFVVFITDGEDNGFAYSYDDLISRANSMGVVIYTVGMGSASESVLRKVADSTGGKYYHATTDSSADSSFLFDLEDVYDEIQSDTVDLTTDSNNDGIPDYYNDLILSGELVLSNGSKTFSGIDFNFDRNGNPSDDYDVDGLKNGDELKIVQKGDKIYVRMLTSPIEYDTDGDGLSDREDSHPLEWNVCDRDLAMCAALCYENGTTARNAGRFYLLDEIDGDRSGGEPGESYYFYGFAHVNEMEKWKVVDYTEDNRVIKIDNFSATTYKNGNNVIIAYRGTNENLEWLDNVVCYGLGNYHTEEEQARAYARRIVQLYPNCNIYITGHSLGGYLAQIGTAELVQCGMDSNLKRVAYFNGIGVAFNMALEIVTLGKSSDKEALYDYSHDGWFTSNHKLVSYAIRGDWVHNLGSHQGDKVEYYAAERCIAHHRSLMSAEYEGLSFWQAFGKAFGSSVVDVAGLALSSVAASPTTMYYFAYYGVPDFVRFTWITHETDSFFAQSDFAQGTRNLTAGGGGGGF